MIQLLTGLGLAFWQKGNCSNALRYLKHAITLDRTQCKAKLAEPHAADIERCLSERSPRAFHTPVYSHGLRSRPETNGTIGVAGSFDIGTARYVVKLEKTGELAALKSANLSSVDGERWTR